MEWRISPTFPDYEVSEFGDVRRCASDLRGNYVGRVRKPYFCKDGYRRYILRRDNRPIHRAACQLVAEAFVGPRPFPGAEVRHGDGTRTNDHFSNLEWGTSKENKEDMLRHGTRMAGGRNHRAKLTAGQVVEIKALACLGVSQRAIGESFGVRQACISKIMRGAIWKTAA